MPGQHLVVVGASLAGLRAVHTARQTGYTGPITLIGAEDHLPYDRPPLSKAFLAPTPPQPGWLVEHEQLHEQLGVDVRLGCRAVGLDIDAQEVLLDDESATGSSRLGYTGLVLATGASARSLTPAPQLEGVAALRTLEDAHALRRALDTGSRVVIVGGGFIGSEVAAAARHRGLPVTLVEASTAPLAHAVGEQVGQQLVTLHEQHGTRLRCGVQVTGLTGTGRVTGVALSDGTHLPADVVVLGIGARPATDWLTDTGLTLDDGIVCQDTLAPVGTRGIYAAGDVARWPNPLFQTAMRVEHWTNATEQAATAARNALHPERQHTHSSVPYVWSDWYGSRLQCVGITDATTEPLLLHRPDTGRFAALYRRGGHLVGAAALDQPRFIVKQRRAIGRRTPWHEARTQAEELLHRTA